MMKTRREEERKVRGVLGGGRGRIRRRGGDRASSIDDDEVRAKEKQPTNQDSLKVIVKHVILNMCRPRSLFCVILMYFVVSSDRSLHEIRDK
jgi:hypothetical protein